MENENQTKKLIYQNALKLFQEKSFQEVTVNEICKASGITKHTFYYYFSSKDALLKKFYVIPFQLTPNDLATILNADSYVEQLWLLNKKMIDFLMTTDIDILRQLFIKNITSDVGTFTLSEEHKQIIILQKDIIKKGQDSGQFLNNADPHILAIAFRHSIMSNTMMRLMKKGFYDSEDFIRCQFEAIFNVAPQYQKMADFTYDFH